MEDTVEVAEETVVVAVVVEEITIPAATGASNATKVDILHETAVRLIVVTNVIKLVILLGIVTNPEMVVVAAVAVEAVGIPGSPVIIVTRRVTLLVIVLILKVHQSATIVDNLGILLGIVTERTAKVVATVVAMMKTEHLGGVVAAEK